MRKRKPALSTQLKAAKQEIEDIKNTVADRDNSILDLEKKLKTANEAKDSWYKNTNDLKAEIEQIHQILDAVPNSVLRKDEGAECYAPERTIGTRLAAWMASR